MNACEAESRLRAYMPIVEREAQRLSSIRLDWRDDLRSAGMVALWKACQSFDEGRGAKFASFASFAVRRAMLDEMRRLMPVSRRVVQWRKRRLQAELDLMQKLMRTPTDYEIAEAIGESGKRIEHKVTAFQRSLSVVSLESPVTSGDGCSLTVADFIADEGPVPGEKISERDYAAELAVLLDKMKPRDRLVFRMRFWEGTALAEIGRHVGVTKARVSQIIDQHCRQMGQKLRSAA